ncbi:hypothetical protein RJ640_006731 [Escallonia rubra]|uniref:Pentatricopeptide repeat-containing protein n=1 Tax=Escallonia rubra TaxID=112253 RepID=A0AA88S1S9_9ASTE|nr:hypothetical protein RJ640_006731 [Escallonia rubra]
MTSSLKQSPVPAPSALSLRFLRRNSQFCHHSRRQKHAGISNTVDPLRFQPVTGKMKEAQEFLEEMSSKGFNPPVRGRDLLIDGLLNAGYLESAKALVRKMTKEGFVPDVGIFNSLTEAVCKSGEVDFCISLYNDVCRLGLCPDIETGGEFEEEAAGSGEEG